MTMDAQLAPDPGETLDRLAGDWWIFQLQAGHRYATDDVLTAFTGVEACPAAARVLDLGAGVGSVGLMALLCLPSSSRLTCVERQTTSLSLLRKTLRVNQLESRVELCPGDLREPDVLDGQFDLILANPPYLPPGSAWPSPQPQRAQARFELHGDIFDYCRTAAAHLAPGGRFCFCHAAADHRPPRAVAAAGLTLRCRREVVFRRGRLPMLALYTCGAECEPPSGAQQSEPLVIREADGERSEAHRAIRRRMWIE